MELTIVENAPRQRLETVVEGQTSVLDYLIQGSTLVITHTGVPPALEGRGIAAALTLRAFEMARQRGLRVDPRCAYAAAWLRRHPDQDDLLA